MLTLYTLYLSTQRREICSFLCETSKRGLVSKKHFIISCKPALAFISFTKTGSFTGILNPKTCYYTRMLKKVVIHNNTTSSRRVFTVWKSVISGGACSTHRMICHDQHFVAHSNIWPLRCYKTSRMTTHWTCGVSESCYMSFITAMRLSREKIHSIY
jgi:hypothetical protein